MSLTDLTVPSAGPCSLCINGDPITLPQKEIAIQGFEFIDNCQALAAFVPVLFQQQSDECNLLQSIGTLCGCPKQLPHPCELCPDGAKAEYGWRELAFLADSFGGITPTCELVEAGLHSVNSTDSYCGGSQMILRDYCGCGAEPGSQPYVTEIDWEVCYLCYDGQPSPFPNKTIDIVGFPFETCGQLEQATKTLFENKFIEGVDVLVSNNCFLFRQLSVHCGCNPYFESIGETTCPICKVDNTNEVPYPEKRLDSSLTKFFMGDMELSCEILADVAKTWSADEPDHSAVCAGLQGLGTHCGCSVPQQPACAACPDSLPSDSFDLTVSDVAPYDLLSCGLITSAAIFMDDGAQIPFGFDGEWIDFECQRFQYLGFLCGCNNGLFTYWGADTLEMQKAAVWVQRGTAVLSLIGSIAILVDIFTTKQRANRGMYYQIMLGLSISDILSSIAWGLGPLPTNPDVASLAGIGQSLLREDLSLSFYGSAGNEGTCIAQGFLLHWGFTSMLYNVALSYFFKLSVVDGWRDSHFTPRYRAFILGAPAIIGTGVALAAIPFITFTPVACTIGSYSGEGGWAKVICLFYLPYGPAFIYAPLNTLYIYWKVRAQSRKGDRWRMSVVRLESFSTKRDEANANDQGSSSERIPAANRKTKRLRRTLSLSNTESQMESLVFWQSCWYVAAFFASYSIFLVAFALDGWTVDSYWFYMLLSILTPMQGFFNGCVYFRKRIVKLAVRGKKKRSRAGSAPLQSLLNRILRSMKMMLRNIARPSQRAPSDPNSPETLKGAVLRASYFPDDSSANLSQPVELLNGRRANTTNVDSEEEEKVEETSLDDDGLPASTSNLSIEAVSISSS